MLHYDMVTYIFSLLKFLVSFKIGNKNKWSASKSKFFDPFLSGTYAPTNTAFLLSVQITFKQPI